MREITFFINIEHPEIRVAELQDGRLHDLEIERDSRLLGNIYLGEIENIVPGMDAAFVDIGVGRNALIYVGDLENGAAEKSHGQPIEKLLKSGDRLVVQVARPPVGSKGARVTAKISLPGRYTVLSAGADTVGVSRRIENTDERERLRRIADKARPLDHGVIVRTEAEGRTAEELTEDIGFGAKQLHAIKLRAAEAARPTLLHRDLGVLGRLARDRMGDSVDRIVIDAPAEYEAFRALVQVLAPAYLDRIHLHDNASPLFSMFNITRDIQAAAQRVVPLSQGGSLVIDEAEALTAIDVNTGKFTGKHRLADTVLRTNLEAVDEAARQLRLRNIGGVVVIDFIDMERTRDRIKVMDALDAALKGDRTRTRIVQLSPLGLVEMTRRREGDSIRHLMHDSCPYCDGDGMVQSPQSVAIEGRRQVRDLARARESCKSIQISLHPQAATAFLGADNEWVRELEASCGIKVFVRPEVGFHIERSAVECVEEAAVMAERSEINLGRRLFLQPNTPYQREGSATYTILSGTLILIETKGGEPIGEGEGVSSQRPAVIEIVKTGPWYHTARVLTSVDPRDE